MTSSDATPPHGSKARRANVDDVTEPQGEPRKRIPAEPVTSEVSLRSTVPRGEPKSSPLTSGDLYIRLEGRIYGPFQPDVMEELLQSGRLTGLEVASPDLHRWTPLAYHPRIRRGRVRDFDKAHDALRNHSALPAKKAEFDLPLADIVRRPPGKKGEDMPGWTEAGSDRGEDSD